MTKHSELRIKTNPNNPSIIASSTPVMFFGNINNSKVATLGINPSKNEFLENGIEFSEEERRFQTLNSLGSTSHKNLTNEQIQKVINSCLNYYNINPYRRWFDILENYILQKLSVSYYSGTACHLDIVQWATDPIWRNLDQTTKKLLIKNDIEFLSIQLQVEKIDTLLINGKGATEIFLEYFKPTLIKQDKLLVGNISCNVYSFELKLKNKIVKIYAWSNNLQSTVGLTNQMREEIGNWVKEQSNIVSLEEPKDDNINYLIKKDKKDNTKINKAQSTKNNEVMELPREIETSDTFFIRRNRLGDNVIVEFEDKYGIVWQYDHDLVYENLQQRYDIMSCFTKYNCYTSNKTVPKYVQELDCVIIINQLPQ
jgi:hypothetical protein